MPALDRITEEVALDDAIAKAGALLAAACAAASSSI
jgi:hypothetical protein